MSNNNFNKTQGNIGNISNTNSSTNRKCRFCGISRPKCDMRGTPENVERLAKWVEILGSEFAENIKNFRTNYVCKCHMDPETKLPKIQNRALDDIVKKEMKTEVETVFIEGGEGQHVQEFINHEVKLELDQEENTEIQMNLVEVKLEGDVKQEFALPMDMPQVADQFQIPETAECRHCGKVMQTESMTQAPSKTHVMRKWIELLGEVFEQNVYDKPAPHFICMSHLGDMLQNL